MANIFLDANYLINALERKRENLILEKLQEHILFTSSLSFHIYCYVFKIKPPDSNVLNHRNKFHIVDFSQDIVDKALLGPTDDFEDNVQLHSAAEEACDIFLTEDKKLLSMKFFGTTRILSELS